MVRQTEGSCFLIHQGPFPKRHPILHGGMYDVISHFCDTLKEGDLNNYLLSDPRFNFLEDDYISCDGRIEWTELKFALLYI